MIVYVQKLLKNRRGKCDSCTDKLLEKQFTTLYWWTTNFKGTMYSFWLMTESDKKTSCTRHKKKNRGKSFHLFLPNNNKHLVFAKTAVLPRDICCNTKKELSCQQHVTFDEKGLGQLRNKRSSVDTRVVMDRSGVINSRLTKFVSVIRNGWNIFIFFFIL